MNQLGHVEPVARNGMVGRVDLVAIGSETISRPKLCDILVHLDGSALDDGKIALAEMVSAVFGARISGHLTNCMPGLPLSGDTGSGWFDPDFWTSVVEAGNASEQRLRRRMDLLEADHELRRFDGMMHDLVVSLARRARSVDLVVLARPYGTARVWPEFVEATLFEAGATALIVPPDAASFPDPQTILIAWKDTVQASHAITAALPFLKRARQVFLATVAESGPEAERHREPASDVAAHLARHGVRIEVRHLPEWDDPANGILNEARSIGADLIVAGAYGRSRIREMILGGVTRDLLRRSTLPLLVSH